MSTKAEISKILQVRSAFHLWQLLVEKDEMWNSIPEIIVFMYSAENFIYGCKCDRDKYFNAFKSDYNAVQQSLSSKNTIRSIYNCSSIIFEDGDCIPSWEK